MQRERIRAYDTQKFMADEALSKAEQRYLRQLQARPATLRSRLIPWALELTPSIGLFVYGLISNEQPFLILGFLSLLYFSVWRMHSQLRGARMLERIIASGAGTSDARNSSSGTPTDETMR